MTRCYFYELVSAENLQGKPMLEEKKRVLLEKVINCVLLNVILYYCFINVDINRLLSPG